MFGSFPASPPAEVIWNIAAPQDWGGFTWKIDA